MRWKRFARDTLVLVPLAVLALPFGWIATPPLTVATASAAGLRSLAYEDEMAPFLASAELALACAAPCVLAWLLDLLYRAIAARPPSIRWLGAVTLALVIALPLGVAWQVVQIRSALATANGSLLALFTVSSLDLGGSAGSMVLRAALVLVLVTAVGARRPA